MADGAGGFDPCECIFNHEMAMRRLLSLLRQSQSYCTEEECHQDGLPGPGQGTGDNGFAMMAMVWVALAMLLYLFRPSSLRGDTKNGPGGNRRDEDPMSDRDPPAVM